MWQFLSGVQEIQILLVQNVRQFVLIYLSRATSWTRRSFDASDGKIDFYSGRMLLLSLPALSRINCYQNDL